MGLYPEDGWTSDKIKTVICTHSSVKQYAIMLHDQDVESDGAVVKPHYHVYLNFGATNWKFNQIAKWFGLEAQYVQKIKSDDNGKNPARGKYCTLLYLTHEEIPEKHYYPPETFVANFDVPEYLRQEKARLSAQGQRTKKQSDLDILIARCASGEISRQNYHEHIPPEDYARHAPEFDRAWSFAKHKALIENANSRNCKTIWIYGESGTGKTRLATLFAEQLGLSAYITHPGNDPLDGYKDEPVIIVDELRPHEGFTYNALLQFIDPHNLSGAHSRYRDKYPLADYIIIASVYSPWDYYDAHFVDNRIDSDTQLYRRLSQVWHVLPSEIVIYKYDKSVNNFMLSGRKKNPIPYFVAQQQANNPETVDPDTVLGEIVDKYDPYCDQFSLFDDSYNPVSTQGTANTTNPV